MTLTLRNVLLSKAVVRTPIETPAKTRTETRKLTESQRLRMQAADAWLELPVDLKVGWTQWAAGFRRYSPVKGRLVCPTARSLFIKLALDRWRLDPGLPTPAHAPDTAFSGDDIGVFVLSGTRTAQGHIRFAATGANRPEVVTALLVQKLSRPGKGLTPRSLRAADFVVFAPGQTSTDLPVEPGHYETAYRFVHQETLQMGPILEAGRVSVDIKRRKARTVKPKLPVQATAGVCAVNLARFASLDVM